MTAPAVCVSLLSTVSFMENGLEPFNVSAALVYSMLICCTVSGEADISSQIFSLLVAVSVSMVSVVVARSFSLMTRLWPFLPLLYSWVNSLLLVFLL
jgi:hypothetical protein